MTIRLYWSGGNRNEINFGDSISPLIVSLLSGEPVEFAPIATCDLAAIGSLLNKIATRHWKRSLHLRLNKIQIWGTGAFGPQDLLPKRNRLAIAAVRGELTRDALQLDRTSTILGDPALLLNRFDLKQHKSFHWGIIPHVADLHVPVINQLLTDNTNTCLINLADPDLLQTARKILSCHFIISTSLHGLIAADAFGIPNVWMRVSENPATGNWKFLDYFSSVGRTETEPFMPTQKSFRLSDLEASASCVTRSLLQKRQNDLENAFKTMAL